MPPKKNTDQHTRPIHGITVTTYEDYHADMQACSRGDYRILMVIGPGGTGKTEGAKRTNGLAASWK